MVKNNLLYRRYEDDKGSSQHLQLVIPRVLRRLILKELHGGVSGGHLGEQKTTNRLKERFYWCGAEIVLLVLPERHQLRKQELHWRISKQATHLS